MKKTLLMVMVLVGALLITSIDMKNTYAAGSFTDVGKSWAKEAIATAASSGLVDGYADGTFKPNATISRAEFTAILSRLLELPLDGESAFADMKDNWASASTAAAVKSGVILSSEFGSKFQPTKAITRLEITKMIGRALALKADYELYLKSFKGLYYGDLPFTDVKKIKAEDVRLVGLAFGSGVIGGYPDDSFGLDKTATRAEATVMLLRLKDAKEKNPATYTALEELRLIAEKGTNAELWAPYLIPNRDIIKEPYVIDHSTYSATLKRVYFMPMDKAEDTGIYERKFIGGRKHVGKFDHEPDVYFSAIFDITSKKDLNNLSISQSIQFPGTMGWVYNEGIGKKFGYYDRTTDYEHYLNKGNTEEWVYYGVLNNVTREHVLIRANGATKGSSAMLFFYPKM